MCFTAEYLQRKHDLINWTAITDYINVEWIHKECKALFQFLQMVKSGLELLQ